MTICLHVSKYVRQVAITNLSVRQLTASGHFAFTAKIVGTVATLLRWDERTAPYITCLLPAKIIFLYVITTFNFIFVTFKL